MHLEKISRLRNDEDYYGAYGKQFLSNSDIDTLINNPADFQKPSEDKIEYKFGRAFHELVMFGDSEHIEEVVEASTRTTKIYKEAVAEAGQMLFLQKEYDQLMFLVDKFQSNKHVDELMLGKNVEYEVPIVGSLFSEDILWKGKADVVNGDLIIDIKTTSNLKSFGKTVKPYNYDSQAFIYSTLFAKNFKFIAVDKNTGVIGIFDVSPYTIADGEMKANIAEDKYIEYFVKQTEEIQNHTIYGTV